MNECRSRYLSHVVATVAFVGIATAGLVGGTTPDAWADHEKEVTSACAAASNLRDAKPGGNLIEFDDHVGFTAVIIDGHYPQPHMKHKRGRVLCLFDKRTRAAFVSDADFILQRRAQ